MVDDVFDVAERVLKSQRKMVSDVMKAVNEQTERAAEAGRDATRRTRRRVGAAKKAARKRAPARKATARKTAAKKTAAKKAPARKAPAKKAPAKKAAAG